ncbi:MAG TPA: hypothetical protein ENJ16_05410, partial [Planctomycetaceae bacterium]|nr:hypothetical protein [Planctomycetaceae bacterium]
MCRRLWSSAAMMLVAITGALAWGDGPVVLLTNDSVLYGTATRERDQWVVELTRGGRVVLPKRDVLARFPSMAEAFAWRQARLDPQNTDAWLSLGFWALRHNYPEGAAKVLRSQRVSGRMDARFAALQEQLRRHVTSASPSPRGSVSPQTGLSWKEVPLAERRFFFDRVEPVLLQRCGMVGCHGPGGDFAFRLLPPHPTERKQSSTSLHNLRTTLRQVDPRTPSASRLADFATRAHAATLTSPPLSPEDPEWKVLAEWLTRLSTPRPDLPEKMLPDTVGPTVLSQLPTPEVPRHFEGSSRPVRSRDPY